MADGGSNDPKNGPGGLDFDRDFGSDQTVQVNTLASDQQQAEQSSEFQSIGEFQPPAQQQQAPNQDLMETTFDEARPLSRPATGRPGTGPLTASDEAHAMPDFPREQVSDAARALADYAKALPIMVKLVPVAFIGVLTAFAMMGGDSGPSRSYVIADQPLMTGPADQEIYNVAALLERNEPVTVIAESPTHVLIQDSSERVGFLPLAYVSTVPQPANHEGPFSRCRIQLLETEPGPCLSRADAQFAECEAGCDDQGLSVDCKQTCGTLLDDCRVSCEKPPEPEPLPAAPVIEPELQPSPIGTPIERKKRKKKRKKRKKRR